MGDGCGVPLGLTVVSQATTSSSSRRRARTPKEESGRVKSIPRTLVMVGLVGFEPTTSASQTQRAAKLRHSPSPNINSRSSGRLATLGTTVGAVSVAVRAHYLADSDFSE